MTDDVLGVVAEDVTLGPGASQTFTASGPVTGTVTNTVTATGALDDPDATAVSETASATVTGEHLHHHGHQDRRQRRRVRRRVGDLHLTVTNNSDSFGWTGDVVDDVLGTGRRATSPSAPARRSATPQSGVITGTVTNTVTATGTFGDPDHHGRHRRRASRDRHQPRLRHQRHQAARDDRRVRRRARSTYTYHGHQQQRPVHLDRRRDRRPSWAWSPRTSPRRPAPRQTFTASGPVTGTVTNTVTADGRARRPDATAVSETASRDGHRRGLHITVTKTARRQRRVRRRARSTPIDGHQQQRPFSWTGNLVDSVLGTVADGRHHRRRRDGHLHHQRGSITGSGHQHRHRRPAPSAIPTPRAAADDAARDRHQPRLRHHGHQAARRRPPCATARSVDLHLHGHQQQRRVHLDRRP